ncbi:MAG: DUF3857 domain-containing protein [Phaeodactylibacter sp.]|nr:DUF3857 domain-containing protein [Phaeodactylibacter sp.]
MTRIDGYPQPAFLALLLSILSLSVYAQKPPMKWGNVDKSDLSMFTYQADTAATAVILCDYAELSVDLGDGDLRYVFEHHRRIKILKRTGFDYADVTIPFYEGQEVSNLKAQLFTPDGQEYEVNKNDIFEEQSSESWSQMKFTFPQVVEGAVIEYRYRLSSTNVLQLREWYFQHEIPTRWSELRLSIPEWYDYIFLNQGRMADISEQGHQMESIRIPAGRSADSRGGGTIQAKVNKYRLAMENVPGLKEEAYVTTMDDYLARIRFQLRSIRYSSSHLDQILSDWPTLAKELNESDYLGRQITKKKNQKALLEALEPIWAEGGAESKEEKALLAYQFLNNTIEWDGHYSIFSDQDLTDCLEKKKAGSGELNLMMLCVLHTLEIEAYPVLLSTREHGKMLELYPILSQFNHLIAMANLNGQMQLLDLGSPARPPGYPRVSALNGSGWIASETNPQWIQFSPPGAKATSMYTMDIDEAGNATVSVNAKFEGYNAVELREELQEDSEGKFLANGWEERYPDAQISSLAFDAIGQPSDPLKVTYEEQLPGLTQPVGDFLYVSPALAPAFEENPFKLEERAYPVEIPYPIQVQDILFINIPEGYIVEELPESGRITLPDDGGKFDFLISENGGKVQVIYKVELRQLKFQPETYASIKNFINIILEKQGEQIVFRKKD